MESTYVALRSAARVQGRAVLALTQGGAGDERGRGSEDDEGGRELHLEEEEEEKLMFYK